MVELLSATPARKARNELPTYCLVLRGKDTLWQAVKQRIRLWMKPNNQDLDLNAAMDLTRSRPELILENLLLRQQLTT